MTRVRFLTAVAILALASPRLDAQQPTVIPLSLGDAARLAAQQSALSQGLKSLRRGHMLELQFPEPSTYAHSPGEVPQQDFENMHLLSG